MRVQMNTEEWPGKDNWKLKKPLGMKSLLGRTSERVYSKEYLKNVIKNNLSPMNEGSIAKGLPIDMLYDFKIHFKGKFRIRYRGKSSIRDRYFRDPRHCIQRYATSFSIYPIDIRL